MYSFRSPGNPAVRRIFTNPGAGFSTIPAHAVVKTHLWTITKSDPQVTQMEF
ncbi:MAG TPA: hypothetical protein PLU72_09970 [Candidatus Ozemobacteraceae bacterium]|nr:hypothetical protein [Candidatus Ozemobacteraceae bacterium]